MPYASAPIACAPPTRSTSLACSSTRARSALLARGNNGTEPDRSPQTRLETPCHQRRERRAIGDDPHARQPPRLDAVDPAGQRDPDDPWQGRRAIAHAGVCRRRPWLRLRCAPDDAVVSKHSDTHRARRTPHGSGLGKDRWPIERTISWLHQFKRLRVCYDRRADIHEAFVSLACSMICWRKLKHEYF